MNPKETKVSDFFADSLSSNEFVVIDIKPHQQTKGNLIILKALADINKMRGLVITLERPHHYLTYLLGIQGIPQRNLTYLDLAHSKIKKVKFPIKISKGNRHIIGGFVKEDSIHIENFDFVIIDNISTAKMYMTINSVINFISYLVKETKSRGVSLIIPLDLSKEKEIFDFIKKFYDKKIVFEEVLKDVY